MAKNGIRILFNKEKTNDEQDRAIRQIQEIVRYLCYENDIYQLEINITTQWPTSVDQQ